MRADVIQPACLYALRGTGVSTACWSGISGRMPAPLQLSSPRNAAEDLFGRAVTSSSLSRRVLAGNPVCLFEGIFRFHYTLVDIVPDIQQLLPGCG